MAPSLLASPSSCRNVLEPGSGRERFTRNSANPGVRRVPLGQNTLMLPASIQRQRPETQLTSFLLAPSLRVLEEILEHALEVPLFHGRQDLSHTKQVKQSREQIFFRTSPVQRSSVLCLPVVAQGNHQHQAPSWIDCLKEAKVAQTASRNCGIQQGFCFQVGKFRNQVEAEFSILVKAFDREQFCDQTRRKMRIGGQYDWEAINAPSVSGSQLAKCVINQATSVGTTLRQGWQQSFDH